MKKLQSILIILISTNFIYAQFASSTNDLSYLENSDLTITDPDKNWPDCLEPQDLHFKYSSTAITLNWDQALEEEHDYEIRWSNSKDQSIKSPSIKITDRTYDVSEITSSASFDQVEIRRICKIENETITSEWVLGPIPCWPYYDVCQDFEYNIRVDCSLNIAVISFQYTSQSCGTNINLDATSGVNTQSSNQNKGMIILPLDGDIVLDLRVMTSWQNQGNNSDDYWLCQFTEPDPCPQNADCDDDGVSDATDNCICLANPNQTDVNGDGIGDACQAFCSNLSFDILPTCYQPEGDTSNYCIFYWQSPTELNESSISYSINS